MWRDATFWAALAAGIVFWGLLIVMTRPVLDWEWPLRYPLAFLLPALVYPVLEEIVFRGGLQELLQRYFRGRAIGPVSLANVGTSVVFAALHFFYHAPLWAAAVFIPSLIFGYFKDSYRRLAPPILLHVFYNTGHYWLFAAPV